jgi:hypothetical protein
MLLDLLKSVKSSPGSAYQRDLYVSCNLWLRIGESLRGNSGSLLGVLVPLKKLNSDLLQLKL